MTGQLHPTLSPHRLPWFSLSVSVLATLLWFWPEATALLQYDRARPFQVWRFLTCHLTHWSADMAFWDIAVFAVLGCICEHTGRRLFALTCLVSAVAVSSAVGLFELDVTLYRGLSGVDSALFGLVAVSAIRRARERSRRGLAWGMGVAFVLFAAKTVYEAHTGSGFFVPAHDTSMRVLPVAHLGGMASGVLVGVLRQSFVLSPPTGGNKGIAWASGNPGRGVACHISLLRGRVRTIVRP